MAELCAVYMEDAETGRLQTRRGRPKRPGTLATDRSRIESHILPLLGAKKVAGLTSEEIEDFMQDVISGKAARRKKLDKKHATSNVRGGTGAAARTMGLLGAIFAYAVRKHFRPDNPVRGIIRPADGRRERRLSDDEYTALGRGIDESTAWPHALSAIRFLALSGWRSGEVLGLRWGEVDFQRRTAHLEETKTGASLRPLSAKAIEILVRQNARVPDLDTNSFVFPASRGVGVMTGFPRIFSKVTLGAGIADDVTPHVLRHSFASTAADLGLSEPTIAALIGHKGGGVTRRYIHSADAVLLAAADQVSERIALLMNGEFPEVAK